jgi:hypothetical protein
MQLDKVAQTKEKLFMMVLLIEPQKNEATETRSSKFSITSVYVTVANGIEP